MSLSGLESGNRVYHMTQTFLALSNPVVVKVSEVDFILFFFFFTAICEKSTGQETKMCSGSWVGIGRMTKLDRR